MSEPRFSPQGIFAALHRHGVDYVVIGGFAANAYGSRRLTLDVDIVPAPEQDNYQRLARALDELGAPESAVDSAFRDLDPRDGFDLAGARVLRLPTSAGDLDLVDAALGAPAYEDLRERAVGVEVRGTPIRIASLDDLIAMKRASGRPQDFRDIAELTGLDESQEPEADR
jgi:predicted nucleotidyltransferase